MRLAYTVIAYLLAPLMVANWMLRGWRERAYWACLPERFGFVRRREKSALWIHAVSAGEVQASAPLVALLRERHPALSLVVTTATPAGRARAAALYGEATVCYLPIDLPGAVARFYARARPAVGVVLETELWPTLYAGAARRGVPLVLASARLSARSASRYGRVRGFTRRVLAGVTVAAQTDADRDRFTALGADPSAVTVSGNLKFDYAPPVGLEAKARTWRAQFGQTRPVWVAGSTHAGEETAVLCAHEAQRARYKDALLILAPRHPPRFATVESALKAAHVAFALRSAPGELPPTDEVSVLLLATLGELECAYASADVAFVGGTLVPVGGHNLLEPAAAGRPVLFGPSYASAAEMASILLGADGAEVVADAPALAAALIEYFAQPAKRLAAGRAAAAAVSGNRGAALRIGALIEPLLVARGLASRAS